MDEKKDMTNEFPAEENAPTAEIVDNTAEIQADSVSENEEKVSADEAPELPEPTDAVPTDVPELPENAPAPQKKKKKKALKIVLIIFAVIFVLLIAAGIYVFRLFNALSKLTDNKTASPSVTDVADVEPGTFADETVTVEGESTSETETDSAGETVTGESTAQADEETASADGTSESSAQQDTTAAPEGGTAASQPVSENTTQAQSTTQAQGTTQANPSGEQNTTAPHTTQPAAEPTSPAPENTKTEYDIYRSGQFHAKGTMTDESGEVSPMELAITSGSVYMLSDFEGVDIGLLHVGNDTYMVYPGKKMYMEMSAVVLKMMGVDIGDLFDTSSFGFSDMEPLSAAKEKSHSDINGVICDRYTFVDKEDGTLNYVYMNGSKLVRIQSLAANGRIASQMDFSQLTADVPADRRSIPSDYKKKSLIDFLSVLGDVI